MAPRASLYVRNSKAVAETNLSQEGMTEELRRLCDRHGFEVAAVHVDNGISGAIRKRPEFQAWLTDGREGRAEVLVTWHVDRLSREGVAILGAIISVVEGKDPDTGKVTHRPVRLMDTAGTDSAVEGWRLPFVVKLEVAYAERERMRDRSRANAQRLRTSGRWRGGHAPYGYRAVPNPDGPGKVLEVMPEEAAVVRRAMDLVFQGRSLPSVARTLNSEGVPPRKAKEWSRPVLLAILTGDAILGRVSHDGAPVYGTDGRPLAPFEPIVSFAEAKALRARLTPKPDGRKTPTKRTRLLSGLLTCSSCGATLTVTEGGRRRERYRCPTLSSGRTCASSVTVVADVAEDYLTGLYLDAVGDARAYEERIVGGTEDSALAELEEAIGDTLRALATEATPELFERLQRLQADREALASAPPSTPRVDWVETGETGREQWEATDLHERRSLLEHFFTEVKVLPTSRGRWATPEERFEVTTARDEAREGGEVPWWDFD